MKIIAIGDTADNFFTLKKFAKSKIHLITFPRKQDALLTNSDSNVEFFDSLLISKQVKRVKEIKDNFDLCIVLTWAAARVAYLAGLNYIIYFVGGDITTPPFVKYSHIDYQKTSPYKLNFIERRFYKKIFDSAIACIAPTSEYYNILKRYRNDAIRLDRVLVDTDLFNDKIMPINLPKKKFTFLSAQRFGVEKGFDVICEALKLCKTDFEVWQVKWFVESTEEEKTINAKLLKNLPPQIKFIPLIKREELPRYFMLADAVLGQIRVGIQGAIERDAAFCKKPVICYTDITKPMIIDNKEIIPPFLPTSKDPVELAGLIDKIVTSEQFRLDLDRKSVV